MNKLAYTLLYVQDVEQSITFYEKSFGFIRKFVTPENDYGELLTGETTLSFCHIDLAKSNLKEGFIESSIKEKPFGIEIGIVTDDVNATLNAAIKNGAQLVEEPIQKPWGQVVGYVRDLDGFLIEICTSMSE
jgi:lactoylglutathione lyase